MAHAYGYVGMYVCLSWITHTHIHEGRHSLETDDADYDLDPLKLGLGSCPGVRKFLLSQATT